MRRSLAACCLIVGLSTPVFAQTCNGRPIAEWIDKLGDLSSSTIQMAAVNLGQCGPGASAALPVLAMIALDPQKPVYARLVAARALFEIDPASPQPDVMAFLTEEVQARNPVEVENAARALGAAGPQACGARPLVQRATSYGGSVQLRAAEALRRIGPC